MASSSSSNTALKTFSLENDILEVSPQDEIYRFDAKENKRINDEQPWKKECVVQHLQTSGSFPHID